MQFLNTSCWIGDLNLNIHFSFTIDLQQCFFQLKKNLMKLLSSCTASGPPSQRASKDTGRPSITKLYVVFFFLVYFYFKKLMLCLAVFTKARCYSDFDLSGLCFKGYRTKPRQIPMVLQHWIFRMLFFFFWSILLATSTSFKKAVSVKISIKLFLKSKSAFQILLSLFR